MKTNFPLASALRRDPRSPDASTRVDVDEEGNLTVLLDDDESNTLLRLVQRSSQQAWSLLATCDTDSGEPVSLPEAILVRANRLMSESGVSLSRDWRTKSHVLRGGYRSTVALTNGDPVHAAITPRGWKAATGWAPAAAAGDQQPQPVAEAQAAQPAPQASPATPAQRPSAPVPASAVPSMAIHGDVAVEASLRRKWKAARAAHANGERALVAIMGPSGQAKTQMVAVLARDEGVPVVKVDCSGMREPGDYFGMPSLENGSSVLIASDLLRVLRSSEPVIVLLDEANRAEIEANNVLLPILDGSGTVTVPQTGKVETVNPFAFFVLTANVGSEYVGTQPWDEAFRTRITTPLHVEYPTADEETKIVRERYPDVSEYDAGNLVALANLLRENADSDGYPAPSTRQVLSAAMHIVHGLSAKEAAETIVDSLQREGGAHSERAKAAVHLNGIVWKEPTPAQKAEAEAAAAAAAEPVTHDTLCENAACGHALAYHGLNPRGQWVAPMGRPVGGCVVCPVGVCTISSTQKAALDQRIARS